jgi:glycine cleavage system H protein
MYPDKLRYTEKHEWIDSKSKLVGLTFFAQDQLGDIVFVELPQVGKELKKGDIFAVIESVKSVSDCYSPVTGKVVEINDKLADEPALLNSSPYDGGWIMKIEFSDSTEFDKLMDHLQYEKYIEEVKSH